MAIPPNLKRIGDPCDIYMKGVNPLNLIKLEVEKGNLKRVELENFVLIDEGVRK